MPDTRERLLEIYLADHLAAATAGVALVRRVARSNSTSEAGDVLRRLSMEIDEDRRTLQRIVTALGFAESKPKQFLAWAAEKVGRVKLNGQLRGYSPLSRVLELEALSIGIAGKLALWQTLQRLPHIAERLSDIHLEQLAERAEQQRAQVEQYRIQAGDEAFARRAESAAASSRMGR